jgi:hypothetical protein
MSSSLHDRMVRGSGLRLKLADRLDQMVSARQVAILEIVVTDRWEARVRSGLAERAT